MTTLKELHNAIQQRATNIGLHASVISSGDIHARYAIVSTSPGPAEERTKIPFSGGAGVLLFDALRKVNLTRNDFYVTNVIKSVVNTRDEVLAKAIPAIDFDHWGAILRWELSQLPNLEYIIVAGNEALQTLTPHRGITNWRGSIVECNIGHRTVKGLATLNPAMVQRAIRILKGEEEGHGPPQRGAKRVFQYDIAKFRKLTQGKLSNYVITEHINPTVSQALDFINECKSSNQEYSLDIETINHETACVGLALSTTEGLCINWVDAELQPRYDLHDELRIRQALQDLCTNNPRAVAQNAVFDAIWLWFKDKIKINVSYDTLLAHHTLYPGLPHSLAFLTSRYTTHPYYKDEKANWKQVGDADRFWRYNVKDCCITLAVKDATSRELYKEKMEEFFVSHVMRLQPHLIRMCVGGVKCDVEYKGKLCDYYETDLAAKLEAFNQAVREATGEDARYNPKSPIQIGELFFRKLKLVGRGTSTDEKNRTRIRQHPRTSDLAKRVIDTLEEYITQHKFFSTYANSRVDPDNRLRTEYKQYGTQSAPGRLSSSQTPWGTGMNLQNQTTRSYPMFCTEPGYVLGYIDGEQAEARVVGWLAKIEKWIADFERARLNPGTFDCHRSLASDMWNIPYDQIPSKDEINGLKTLRFTAKRCRHGLNYRMAIERLAETTGLSKAEATDAYHRYHRINPQLRKWWDSLEGDVRKDGILYNLFGRRWVLTEILTEQALEAIVAFKPQSTIGDLINRVTYLAEEDDEWPNNARIILNTHDGLICIAPEAKIEKCLQIMVKHAQQPIPVPGMPDLIIPAGVKRTYRGSSWTINEETKEITLFSDEKGLHRWSDLENLSLAA